MRITYASTGNTGQGAAPVLPFLGFRPLAVQGLLIVAAILLPVAAHLAGAPVRMLLPMHWPILLAGLIYGWRGGMLVGFLAPFTNYLLTGYPLIPKLIPMTVELAAYGLLAGWLREKLRWNNFAAVGAALVGGRTIFLGTILLTGGFEGAFGAYVVAAMGPGLIGGLAQLAVVPLVAGWLIRDKRNQSE